MFGGGGRFMPSLKLSPVDFRFQTTDTLWFMGCSMVMAPGLLHSRTQVPQYQHSSGYRTMGGFPCSGLGMRTSERQMPTQGTATLRELRISQHSVSKRVRL